MTPTAIPTDPTTELLVIGCCLAGGRAKAEVALQRLTEEDFHDLAHAAAFRVIAALVADGQPVDDPGIVMHWPKIVTMPPRCPTTIMQAANLVASAENLPVCIAQLREMTRRRRAWNQGHRLLEHCGDMKRDIGELCTGVAAALEGHDREASQDAVDGAGLCALLTDDLERRHQLQGRLSGISTGFPALDTLTEGLQAGELSVIGARPSQGKTALLLAVAAQAALRDEVPTLIVSLEMTASALLRRLASMETDIPASNLRAGKLTPDDFKKLTTFQLKLKRSGLEIFDGIGGSNVNRIAGIVRWHVEKRGVRLVLVDYLQKIRPTTRHEKRTYEVAECSGALKAIAARHGIHICTAAQLNREPDKTDSKGKGRLPRLADLTDSGQIERDADLVALLSRERTQDDPQGSHAKLFVAKQRDGELGTVQLHFDAMHCRFEP